MLEPVLAAKLLAISLSSISAYCVFKRRWGYLIGMFMVSFGGVAIHLLWLSKA